MLVEEESRTSSDPRRAGSSTNLPVTPKDETNLRHRHFLSKLFKLLPVCSAALEREIGLRQAQQHFLLLGLQLLRIQECLERISALSDVLDLQLMEDEIVSNHLSSCGVRVKVRITAARQGLPLRDGKQLATLPCVWMLHHHNPNRKVNK